MIHEFFENGGRLVTDVGEAIVCTYKIVNGYKPYGTRS